MTTFFRILEKKIVPTGFAVGFAILIFVSAVVVQATFHTWRGPSAAPPDENKYAPITTGPAYQEKSAAGDPNPTAGMIGAFNFYVATTSAGTSGWLSQLVVTASGDGGIYRVEVPNFASSPTPPAVGGCPPGNIYESFPDGTKDCTPQTGSGDGFAVLSTPIVYSLCSDVDGCEIVVGMKDYDATRPGVVASTKPIMFFYTAAQNYWSTSLPTLGNDGVSLRQNIAFVGTGCIFSDADTVSRTDTRNRTLSLDNSATLNYRFETVCTLNIRD